MSKDIREVGVEDKGKITYRLGHYYPENAVNSLFRLSALKPLLINKINMQGR